MADPIRASVDAVVSTLKTIRRMHRALQDSGGAASDYQATVQHLERLESSFSVLVNTTYSGVDAEIYSIANALGAQAKGIQNLIGSFADQIVQYESTLGVRASKLPHKAAWSKIKWGSHSSRHDIKDFEDSLGARTAMIDWLHKSLIARLSVATHSLVRDMHTKFDANHETLSTRLFRLETLLRTWTDASDQNILRIEHGIEYLQNSTSQIAQIIESIGPERDASFDTTQSQILRHLHEEDATILQLFRRIGSDRKGNEIQIRQISKAGSRRIKFQSKLKQNRRLGYQGLAQAVKHLSFLSQNAALSDIQNRTVQAHDVSEVIHDGVEKHHQLLLECESLLAAVRSKIMDVSLPPSPHCHDQTSFNESNLVSETASGSFSVFDLTMRLLERIKSIDFIGDSSHEVRSNQCSTNSSIIKALNLLTELVGHSSLRVQYLFLKPLLRTIRIAFFHLISYFVFVYPKLQHFMRTLNTITWSPSWVRWDNIRFEDVLGRSHSLQWAYFRNWVTFNAMLEHQFKGQPGEAKVARKEYQILKADSYDIILSESNWESSILPGTRLVMSILIEQLSIKSTVCPRGCIGILRREMNSKAICANWGLEVILSGFASKPRAPQIEEIAEEDEDKPLNEDQTKHSHVDNLPRNNLPNSVVEAQVNMGSCVDPAKAKHPKWLPEVQCDSSHLETTIGPDNKHHHGNVHRREDVCLQHKDPELEKEIFVFRRVHHLLDFNLTGLSDDETEADNCHDCTRRSSLASQRFDSVTDKMSFPEDEQIQQASTKSSYYGGHLRLQSAQPEKEVESGALLDSATKKQAKDLETQDDVSSFMSELETLSPSIENETYVERWLRDFPADDSSAESLDYFAHDAELALSSLFFPKFLSEMEIESLLPLPDYGMLQGVDVQEQTKVASISRASPEPVHLLKVPIQEPRSRYHDPVNGQAWNEHKHRQPGFIETRADDVRIYEDGTRVYEVGPFRTPFNKINRRTLEVLNYRQPVWRDLLVMTTS